MIIGIIIGVLGTCTALFAGLLVYAIMKVGDKCGDEELENHN